MRKWMHKELNTLFKVTYLMLEVEFESRKCGAKSRHLTLKYIYNFIT